MTEAEQIQEDLLRRAAPIGFVSEVLGLPLYDWQAGAIAPLEKAGWGKPIVQISVLAPNGAGKSSQIVAGSALWWTLVHSKGKVAITTADGKQLNEQIIPAIEAEKHKLEGLESVRSPYYQLKTKTGGKIVAYTTDDAGRAEGFHGSPESPLLEIVDEAKSIREPIFQAIDRCGYQALIYCSTGGLMTGSFYDSQTKNRAMFHCIKAGLKDCPHISPDKVQRIIDKWGENHPFTRSCVYGEFMSQDEDTQFCVTHAAVAHARENPPRNLPGLRVAFVDFAEGAAEYVLAIREGNKCDINLAFREGDKRAACSRLIGAFVSSGLKQEQIYGDAADKESCDLLASLGWTIHRQNFGAKAKLEEVYQSWSAEAWIETGIAISKGEIVIPNDEILVAQLTSRKKEMVGRGKWAAEEKYEMRKRGIESPDRADAFCGCFNVYPAGQAGRMYDASFWQSAEPKEDEFSQSMRDIGAYAGY